MDLVSGMSYVKPTPAFSFYTIIDEDLSMLSYIIQNYYDMEVFDFSYVYDMDFMKVINMLYYRTVDNPLYLFMKEGADKKFVDNCYEEFLSEKEEEILNYGILTEVPELILMFEESFAISPCIFYYNDCQKYILDEIEALDIIDKVPFEEIDNSKNTQIYIYKHQEVKNFPDFKNKTFYMASSELNRLALDHMNDIEHLEHLALNGNRISVYDMYNRDIIAHELIKQGE